MRKLLLGAATATALALAAQTPATAAPADTERPVRSVHGWARLDLFGPVPEPSQLLTLVLDARTGGRPPAAGRGHATVRHTFDRGTDKESTVQVEIRVDCLAEAGGDVVVTGTADSVTYTTGPAADPVPPFPRDRHPEVALVLRHDGQGRSRVAWTGTGAPDGPPVAAACRVMTDTGPDLHLVHGGFTVRR